MMYDLNQTGLEQVFANLNLAGGLVSAIDSALIDSGMYPHGKIQLPTVVQHDNQGNNTISLDDSVGLFIESGAGKTGTVWDTVSFSGSQNQGHVLTTGDGDSVSLVEKGQGDDTLIAGYNPKSATYQTLQVTNGNNLLVGGLYKTAHDNLIAGIGDDTLLVLAGHNTLTGGIGDDTFVTLGGKNVLNAGTGSDSMYIGNGSNDVIHGSDTLHDNIYVDTSSANSIDHGKGIEWTAGGVTTTVDVATGSATVHFTGGGTETI